MLPPLNCRYSILFVLIEEMLVHRVHKLLETSVFWDCDNSRLLRREPHSFNRCVLLLGHQVEQNLHQSLGIQKWQSLENRFVFSRKNAMVGLNDGLNFGQKRFLANSARTRIQLRCDSGCGSSCRFGLFRHGRM